MGKQRGPLKGRPLMGGMPTTTISSRGAQEQQAAKERMAFLRQYTTQADGACGSCGAPVFGWFRFCPNCGNRIDWPAEAPPGPRSDDESEPGTDTGTDTARSTLPAS